MTVIYGPFAIVATSDFYFPKNDCWRVCFDDHPEIGSIGDGKTFKEAMDALHEDINAGVYDNDDLVTEFVKTTPHPGHPYPYGDLTWTFKIGDEPYEANLSGDKWIVFDRNDNAVRDERIIAAAKHSLETGISYIQAREVAA